MVCERKQCTVRFVGRDVYGDGLYQCTKCQTVYSELSAEHNGLVGAGAMLRGLIEANKGKE